MAAFSRSVGALFVVVALLVTPSAVLAKKKLPEPETRHYALNEQAVEALAAGDYPHAIELLEESLVIAELNITYLNLGRAYAKNGQCNKALEMYDRMAVAPRVEEPPPDVILGALTKYRTELLEQCTGHVRVRCTPATLQVSVDGGEPQACPSAALELPPGAHRFEALDAGQLVASQETELEGMSVSYVDLIAPKVIHLTTGSGGRGRSTTLTWTTLGVGAGLLIVGGLVNALFIAPDVEFGNSSMFTAEGAAQFTESLDTKQTFNSVILVSGGALLATGVGLLIYDLVIGSDGTEGVSAFVDDEHVGLSYKARF